MSESKKSLWRRGGENEQSTKAGATSGRESGGDSYDVAIIGAGPNGLTLADYLVNAGAKVLLLEKRYDIGGSLVTEDFGGSRFNLHAMYMPLSTEAPPYNDLQLSEYGCLFVEPSAQATVHTNGSRLTLYRDLNKTLNSISKISPGDSKKFEKLSTDLEALNSQVFMPWLYNAPSAPDKAERMMEGKPIGKVAKDVRGLTPLQTLEHYGFESDAVKLALLSLACMRGVTPTQERGGLTFLLFLRSMLRASLVRGGSYLLASGLHKIAVMKGVTLLVGAEVAEIMTRDGAAAGVRLADGRIFGARAVVSTVDIPATFTRLLSESKVSTDMTSTANKWQWDPWSLFQANFTFKGKPEFKNADEGVQGSLIHVVGYSGVDDFLRHTTDVLDGKVRAAGFLSFPTLLDDSQAPKGMSVARFTAIAPYRLVKGNWDDLKESLAEECFNAMTELVPNVTKKSLVWNYPYPPTYVEMKTSNAVRGSINGGAYTPLQMGYKRPNETCSSYRTPVKGLYVCGSGVHPGGGVTLAGGYNAAGVIAEDLGMRRWWEPKFRT